MAEYIERGKVLDMSYCPTSLTWDNPLAEQKSVIDVDDIKSIPAADVAEVKHGYWKKEKLVMCEPYYLCSICGKLHDQEYLYCNECGAKMDGTPKERSEE